MVSKTDGRKANSVHRAADRSLAEAACRPWSEPHRKGRCENALAKSTVVARVEVLLMDVDAEEELNAFLVLRFRRRLAANQDD